MAMRNIMKTGLPIGAFLIALVTAVGAAVAYGAQSQQVETNCTAIEKNESAILEVGKSVDKLVRLDLIRMVSQNIFEDLSGVLVSVL